MMHCARSSSSCSVKLLLSTSSAGSSSITTTGTTGVGGGRLVCFHLGEGWEEREVDLGAIGRALGLEPASVRLNGYLLGTRGPDHVAASVTWGSLQAFFSARGYPTGRGGGGGCESLVAGGPAAEGPIIVQGRSASAASFSEHQDFSGSCYHYHCIDGLHQACDGGRLSGKRRLAFHGGSPFKREKLWQSSSALPEEAVTGDDLLCERKKRRLEDENPVAKKREKTECDSGPCCDQPRLSTCSPPAGFASNCAMGHRKRPRDDELARTLPCKRTA